MIFFRLPERLLRVQIIDKIKKGEYIIIRPFLIDLIIKHFF